MLILDARRFGELIEILAATELIVKQYPVDVSVHEEFGPQFFKKASVSISKFCKDLELPTSADAAEILNTASDFGALAFAIQHVKLTIFSELKSRNFYGPLTQYSGYFENPNLFGDAVFKSFSSANDDIIEAGTCLALERGTACVMHLMRVMEAALKALAHAVGVTEQNDWGSYLKKIDSELDKRKNLSGAHTPEDQFYSEASAQFDHVRRAWRNPTMHIEKSYSPQRADEILIAVKSFLAVLATKISESENGSSLRLSS
jgi:hypothetical protein